MHRYRLILASLLASIAVLASQAVSAQAATSPTYVALGDSYGAGVGTRVYYADNTGCYRSPLGYAARVARQYDLSLTLAACSGATTIEVVNTQAGALRRSTNYVSVTVGGNDLGFVSVLTSCALPGWLGNCRAAVDRARVTLQTSLPDRLTTVLSTIRERAPRANVVVTGYPRLFNGEDCSLFTFFSADDEARLNAATDELNAVIESRARAAGMRYVDPVPAFESHAWCDDRAWVNGLSYPLINSFHPNRAGHAAYAELVGPALVGSPVRTASADRRALSTSTAVDGHTRTASAPILPSVAVRGPYTFTVPDLDSAATARAAAKAGVTKKELAQLRQAQHDRVPNAELDRLDAKITAKAAKRKAGR